MILEKEKNDSLYSVPAPDALGRLARTGASWSISLLIVRQLFGIGVAGAFARLLSPDDFGLVAMVVTLTGFLALISDMGLSWATVYDRQADFQKTNSLFWIGGLLGIGTWLACIISSPLLAWFYKKTELIPISIALGAGLFINGLSIQPTALLKRKLRQKALSIAQLLATVLAGLVAILLAWMAARYWALVAQTMVSSGILLLLALAWSGFRPGRPRLSPGTLKLLKFGGLVGACNIITYFQVNLDNILVGRFCSAADLGFYSRAFYLQTLPAMYISMAITDVMIPAFTTLAADKERLAAAFRKAVTLMAFISFPVGACLGITAYETVRIIYGSAWLTVAVLLQWLALPAMILPLAQSGGWLFIATGKVREMMLLSLSTFPIVCIVYIYAVTSGGVLGMAIAVAALFSIPLPLLTFYMAIRAAKIDFIPTLKPVMKIAIICAAASAAAIGAGSLGEILKIHWLIVFLIKVFAGAFTYLTLALIFIRPLPINIAEKFWGIFRWVGGNYIGN